MCVSLQCYDCIDLEVACGAAPHATAPAESLASTAAQPNPTLHPIQSNPSRPPPSPPRVPLSLFGLRAADYWVENAALQTNAWWDAMAPRGALGSEVIVKGASWSGMERSPCLPGGASDIDLNAVASLLHREGLNAVRVPLAVDGVLSTRFSPGSCLPHDDVLWQHNVWLTGELSCTCGRAPALSLDIPSIFLDLPSTPSHPLLAIPLPGHCAQTWRCWVSGCACWRRMVCL